MQNQNPLFSKVLSAITVFAMTLCSTLPKDISLTAKAVSVDYPVQLMNIATKDNSKVVTETSTKDNSAVSVQKLGNNLAPSWRFDRVGADANGTYFKLCNAESGRLLTPKGYQVNSGAEVVMYGYESDKTQHWYVVPVKQDHLGNDLYYKIVNYSDTGLALTQGANGLTLEKYTGADSQLWLLNADGLQGFAGYCSDDNTGNIKAGDIGGLFGETVEVSNFDELKKYATSDTPYTIVVTDDIKVTNLQKDSQNHYYCPDGRIYVHSNKTIVGSYSNHTLYNVQFCTATKNGVGDNVVIKNFDLQHDADSNGNDSIVVYFGSGENLWVDHVTFTGHADYNKASTGEPDWDKFLACCYDADYCTVSDSSFGLHEYGVI
ncbi:MAG: RICIN domain-containing protein, partial [Oscillospiraceae bacterium]|nr:RICIN domain-containing protein [Oscillospiraceae bacterium]